MISFLTGEIRNIFPEKSIVEINVSGVGYEVSLPTFVMDDLWLALFSDFGAVAPDWGAMELDRFRVSVGAGLRWLVSGQIPLRLDVAYPLDTTPFSSEQFRAHLNIFYTL